MQKDRTATQFLICKNQKYLCCLLFRPMISNSITFFCSHFHVNNLLSTVRFQMCPQMACIRCIVTLLPLPLCVVLCPNDYFKLSQILVDLHYTHRKVSPTPRGLPRDKFYCRLCHILGFIFDQNQRPSLPSLITLLKRGGGLPLPLGSHCCREVARDG